MIHRTVKTTQQALETYITLLQEGVCSRLEWWTRDKELRGFNINNEQNILIKWTTACVEEVTIPDSARYMFLDPKLDER